MVVSPLYRNAEAQRKGTYANAIETGVTKKLWAFGKDHTVSFHKETRSGVDWVFVSHPSFDDREGGPYGDDSGAYGDNQFRFCLLSMAACEAPLLVPCGASEAEVFGEKVVFLANDWHAALVPVLVAAKYRPHGVFGDARTVLAIHNMSHQGVEPATTFPSLGLGGEWYKAVEWIFPQWARAHAYDRGEAVNLLKGAIVTADRITTVSEGHAWEITTPEGGWGLDHVLQSREFVLNGITNGIDTVEWDPASDAATEAPFSLGAMGGKAACKAALQRELGLPERADVPLVAFIGRLDYQKGPDVILDALPRILEQNDVQLVMLGDGSAELEERMRRAEERFRDKMRGWRGFNVPLSHRLTAGADILLMPSRWEPCGLNQLYAMRYGTVPVVHATGGLRDTVQQYCAIANGGSGDGTGFSFQPLTLDGMLSSLFEAVGVFRDDEEKWAAIVERGMAQDLAWSRVAKDYEQVFQWAADDPPYA